MRSLTVFFISTVYVLTSANEDESVRVKRVSVEGVPSADVGFDGDAASKNPSRAKGADSKPQRFRQAARNGQDITFPIVLPPYNLSTGVTPGQQDPKEGTCLLYMEHVNVIVFNKNSKEPSAAVAVINAAGQKNTYSYSKGQSVNCLDKTDVATKTKPKETTFFFQVDIDVKETANAYRDQKSKEVLFSVSGPLSFILTFNRTAGYGWVLADVEASAITVKNGQNSWLTKSLSTKQGSSSKESVRYVNMYGFNDYSYACSSTAAAVWPTDDKDYTIGLSFGNVQIQAWDAVYTTKDKKTQVRFGYNVNDCVGTFSPGSWMGIIVSIVLASVLIFGYLMLNSVQTMDRFDDPKQKQLIINAKE
jgi:hypothetical protein